MPKLKIDHIEVTVPEGSTVMQACHQAGRQVPHFCYHDRLSIAGNCRMCLVEMERSPKPIASCAMPAQDGMVIRTQSPVVEKARKGVMEFLLINHPLDCPICDQGGECDLQDQALHFGMDRSRYNEKKRAVKDKELGPIVKTVMTRCIHCTRCVRFTEEIAGQPVLGGMFRGENMEIDTYIQSALTSELSGNLVDLCPVGALTSKPLAFQSRSWELHSTNSIDVMDAMGANISIESSGDEVVRILPRLHDDVNEEWISDKTRYVQDALKRQRLDQPYVREGDVLNPCSWEEAFDVISKKVKQIPAHKIAALVGETMDCESMLALKNLMENLGSPHLDCRQDGSLLGERGAARSSYLFNTTFSGISQSDACLIIGANVRWEAPLVNVRLRQQWIQNSGKFPIGLIGEQYDLTYPYEHLGQDIKALDALLDGKSPFDQVLKSAQNPMIIVGTGILSRKDSLSILCKINDLVDRYNVVYEGWNGFNILHTAASRVGGLDMEFVPAQNGRSTQEILKGCEDGAIELLYLLGADECRDHDVQRPFVIYQGCMGDRGAQQADVILPGCAYTEKSGTYVNMEGRVQRSYQAVCAPGLAKEDWKIIRALSEKLGCTLDYDDLFQVRRKLEEVSDVFQVLDHTSSHPWSSIGKPGKVDDQAFCSPIKNFYMTDAMSRTSVVLAQCSDFFHQSSSDLEN